MNKLTNRKSETINQKTVRYKTETKERKMETYVVGKQKNEN